MLTVFQVQYLLWDKSGGLRGHVEVIWNNFFFDFRALQIHSDVSGLSVHHVVIRVTTSQ